ncbi:MAG: type II secretion system protein GspK [Halioglobus sp.]|nr:type II secretion system protein GspK [Halioglobus sp.]
MKKQAIKQKNYNNTGQARPAQAGQRGVALAIVVWFIAGMSLLVAGIVSSARVDTKMTQLHIARAKSVAAGDGAIQLMLADHLLREAPAAGASGLNTGEYWLGNVKVVVMLYPSAGLIDLNAASQKLLAALFFTIAQVPEGNANVLADNVVKWRSGVAGVDEPRKTGNRFRSIEDLLRVEGISRTLFDAVKDFIVASDSPGAATNWALAPEVLLQVLEKSKPEDLAGVKRRREQLANAQADRKAGAEVQPKPRSLSGTYRIDALVRYGDQTWLRRRWVAVGATRGSLLPWQVLRTEPARVYEYAIGNR